MKKWVLFVFCCCLVFAGNAFAKSGTLLVAFGTTKAYALPALENIENAFKKTRGGEPLIMAYTSDIIRNKLAKQGKEVFSVNAALNKMLEHGVTDLTIQSLHVLPAEEYMQLERMVIKFLTQNPNKFTTVKVGYPLLVSQDDLHTVVQTVLSSLPQERAPEDGVVLMAHGNNRGPGDLELMAVNAAFQKANPRVWVAAVEGACSFEDVLKQLKASEIQRVWLQPFMIVAGDHARNDLAGDEEDSWASQIKAAGMMPMPRLIGLGELEGIQQLFVQHAQEAVVDLANTRKAD